MPLDTNNYWEQLERLEKLIRASELKAGIIFSFHSLILGLFVDRIENFQHVFKESYWFVGFAIFWIVCVVVSIVYCFKCIKPSMALDYDNNVFFFRNAAKHYANVKEYKKELMRVCNSEEEIESHLSEQVHAESVIIDEKFYHVKRAIQFFVLSFIFVVAMITTWVVLDVF